MVTGTALLDGGIERFSFRIKKVKYYFSSECVAKMNDIK